MLPLVLLLLTLASAPVGAQAYRCTDAEGRTVYQLPPCDSPAARSLPPDALPASEVELLDRWRKSPPPSPGLGLHAGMTSAQTVERWGRPTGVRDHGAGQLVYRWCDRRTALIIDDRLRQWEAPDADSRAGASLFSYGQPSTAATQKWGDDRRITTYSSPTFGRGELQTWGPRRWIVTDGAGRIVGWCDAR